MLRGPAEAGELGAKPAQQLALGVGAPVGEGALRELPDALVRVELRRIAGEAIEVQSGKRALELPDGLASMDRAVVPDQHDGSTQMPKQVAEKLADLGMLDVLRVQTEVETQAAALRTDR